MSQSQDPAAKLPIESTNARPVPGPGGGPGRGDSRGDVGVYVHIPFCERVCPYCDFAVVAARPLVGGVEDRYVDALLEELARRAELFADLVLSTVYLGGGTPSLLRPESVARIVSAVRKQFAAAEAPEITLEVNPSNLECDRLPAFREAGVNRLSLGVQSFDDSILRRLGRAHKAEDAHRSLAATREAGFSNVSLDIIFGAPGSSAQQLERDLDHVMSFSPEHLSAYQLTVESGTPFALADARGQLALPDQDASAQLSERFEQRASDSGLARYELSSYARPGFESRHNQRYWERKPVLGLGMGAWSSEPARPDAPHGSRSGNTRKLAEYLECVENGRAAQCEHELSDPRTARGEAIFLGLRRIAGLRAADFSREFGAAPGAFFREQIDSLVAADLLAEDLPSGDLALTKRGRMLADSIFQEFV